ncbi:barstar family protein [Mucilaginibacter sp. Mucisp84]|uniref:barstar family protein n=1 Tax=Mucilaginibacter sp. Mucisp84 TaxID=3243058 RepID=UPI0039A4001F
MVEIVFLNEPDKYFDEGEFVAHLPAVEGEGELLKKLSEVLKFPDYFGGNWNAVYDCLCDFHWIEKKGVVLVHNVMPMLTEEKLKAYIEVLHDATKSWGIDEAHYFKVMLPVKSMPFLEHILINLK